MMAILSFGVKTHPTTNLGTTIQLGTGIVMDSDFAAPLVKIFDVQLVPVKDF